MLSGVFAMAAFEEEYSLSWAKMVNTLLEEKEWRAGARAA